MQQTVKSAMSEGYKFNFVQSSVSTESIYFSILSESRLFHFRISSHVKKTDIITLKLIQISRLEMACY
ncbi:hypothetical protein EGW65_09695 [Enterococcus faecium]|nr:hypothetical protein [Enterococcus faecium]PQE50837.1 hypothetical protein CUS31_08445 [Enterococcus faecium]ROX88662.1 hypothetical protein EGW41_09695 [Enterococcus faecium]ROY62484.1 hypothetical protein EGW65_09695 [Enterococcus faecium]